MNESQWLSALCHIDFCPVATPKVIALPTRDKFIALFQPHGLRRQGCCREDLFFGPQTHRQYMDHDVKQLDFFV